MRRFLLSLLCLSVFLGSVQRVEVAEVDTDQELRQAAYDGDREAVARLLNAGVDPSHAGNSLGMGMTALHLAAGVATPGAVSR